MYLVYTFSSITWLGLGTYTTWFVLHVGKHCGLDEKRTFTTVSKLFSVIEGLRSWKYKTDTGLYI